MEQVAVIGAGAMGRQIALQCALRGFTVVLHDSRAESLGQAMSFYREYLDGRIAKGKLSAGDHDAALGRLRMDNALADAVKGAAIVIEAIIEQFEPKAELFRQLDVLCPADTLLTTNSSNIRGSRLAEATTRPGQVLNLHFFNPALVMELVEVVVHPAVPEAVIARAMDFCRRIGKTPVLMRKEVPGFIVNRIFRALTKEAVNLLEGGYATAEDIDLAVMKGLGHPMGPLRLLDSTGIDVSYLARMDEYLETGVEAAKPNDLLKQMYESGSWGKKSGRGFYDYAPKD
ncbi:MAG: 3-hydroxyacyl-CoA dehydrogenase family protein [Sulfuricaulis sp.]|nr:3-hydroxyacyl-CoA dehydrogenase family protein [Sulfuricaulis sp.]